MTGTATMSALRVTVRVMPGFATFDEYLDVPRVTSLALSPNGLRLVAGVSALNDDG